jgi:hypothetical protein
MTRSYDVCYATQSADDCRGVRNITALRADDFHFATPRRKAPMWRYEVLFNNQNKILKLFVQTGFLMLPYHI